jgi:hypothetical protein
MRVAAVLVLAVPMVALADAPLVLTHQGRLVGSDGAPLNGSTDVRITLYDQQTSPDPGFWTHLYAGQPVQDGYYAVPLVLDDGGAPLDPADFADGEVWVGVSVGSTALGPRQRLGSVPYALVAGSASSGGATVPVVASVTGACEIGATTYVTSEKRLRICVDGDWGQDIVQDVGFRRWADGTYAASCDGYRHPASDTYTGATGDGVYRINPGGTGPIDVWCEMDLQGGGWTQILNLDTNDGSTRNWNDTAFWTSTSAFASVNDHATGDFKSAAFDRLGGTELLIEAHNEGAAIGSARYAFLSAYQGVTLYTMLSTLSNTTVTATRTASTGAIGAQGRQDNYGDSFIDHPHAVVINSTYSPAGSTNLARFGTNYASLQGTAGLAWNCNMYGGLGGSHLCGSWGAVYEGASINEYCSTQGGYGSNGTAYPSKNNAFDGTSPCGSAAVLIQVDFAFYVR